MAKRREQVVYQDKDGNIVHENNRYGKAINLEMLHPEYILFADKTGINTSSKEDGNKGGTKFLCKIGQVLKIKSTTSENQCTVLLFTSATGEAIMCVLIYMRKGEDIAVELNTGVDLWVIPFHDTDGNIIMDNRNINGKGKFMPCGPTCLYKGIEIPCRTYISESGGITAKILVDLLQMFDTLFVFPRDAGVTPVLIVNGHESCLHHSFLEYVNNPAHKWHVCLGVPYATSYWQVGGLHEQNGTFKTNWYRVKRKLMR